MKKLIELDAAIETVRKAKNLYQAHRMLVQLPAAQPTQNERVNSNGSLDTVSRQAAIEAIENTKEVAR